MTEFTEQPPGFVGFIWCEPLQLPLGVGFHGTGRPMRQAALVHQVPILGILPIPIDQKIRQNQRFPLASLKEGHPQLAPGF